ncbi:hypothetical protein [Aeoliella mucimassa]|uniref:Uncharacterized protein n=1 Tax=Aeoliella mucimassa TaxID=2527972 RepID=A0A518ATZ1_9BACT|nr:hypothetical protein [Aeoliella mucimassa]QDU58192.1 hypothetical protein Pan181_44250 [Aeoliella mucimassa]
MKHITPTLTKFKRLARRLGLRDFEAAGVLELLWIATQNEARRGDIGRLSNEEIAIAIDWGRDENELVDALVETGWLDPHPEHRLVVHDWCEHAPRYVKGVVSRQGGFIVKSLEVEPTSSTYVDDVGSTLASSESSKRTNATYVDNARPERMSSAHVANSSTHTTLPNQTPPHPSECDEASHACDWGEVVDKLEGAGVSQTGKAIASARENGVAAEHVLEVVAYWSRYRNGWSQPALALYRRVCAAKPDLQVSEGWLDFRRGYAAADVKPPLSAAVQSLMAELDADDGLSRIVAGSHSFPRTEWKAVQQEAAREAPHGLPRNRVNLLAAKLWREKHQRSEVSA